MAITIYLANSYPYDPSLASVHTVSGGLVRLVGNTANQTYSHTAGGSTISVQVVDFILDANDPASSVELEVVNFRPTFAPVGGVQLVTSASPFRFRFTSVPVSGDPDHKWGVNDPIPGITVPTPGWTLRVTVKRK